MTTENVVESSGTFPHVGEFRRVVRLLFKRKVVLFGGIIILLVVLAAIFAAQIAPYNPYDQSLTGRCLNPAGSISWELTQLAETR
jgi:ABC-type antimicrobial peptide transport system permease subunit